MYILQYFQLKNEWLVINTTDGRLHTAWRSRIEAMRTLNTLNRMIKPKKEITQ